MISIHALREEGDVLHVVLALLVALFLSAPSARRATINNQPGICPGWISIHALREEGDYITVLK